MNQTGRIRFLEANKDEMMKTIEARDTLRDLGDVTQAMVYRHADKYWSSKELWARHEVLTSPRITDTLVAGKETVFKWLPWSGSSLVKLILYKADKDKAGAPNAVCYVSEERGCKNDGAFHWNVPKGLENGKDLCLGFLTDTGIVFSTSFKIKGDGTGEGVPMPPDLHQQLRPIKGQLGMDFATTIQEIVSFDKDDETLDDALETLSGVHELRLIHEEYTKGMGSSLDFNSYIRVLTFTRRRHHYSHANIEGSRNIENLRWRMAAARVRLETVWLPELSLHREAVKEVVNRFFEIVDEAQAKGTINFGTEGGFKLVPWAILQATKEANSNEDATKAAPKSALEEKTAAMSLEQMNRNQVHRELNKQQAHKRKLLDQLNAVEQNISQCESQLEKIEAEEHNKDKGEEKSTE